mmetsp:Transcript_22040/g.52465  ORF Transcript_22040/g.52465 Transcript_22040/m.52465 type:complete len:689 (+) Transcript_22040:119-2185(+)|eukprot:CAMPEP_0197184704 /NCGR_PEP_ID=MMETSP1423-20130617/10378_1 /TAXON_ID=476441 /ORGANISM="Pseudo-nitzschia heimii, Strain UNC1101" /LENGTH=688 /DNA_ID=CAMNT_0042635585 /DNA_START=106 /DNA_END=2172 /DNA_ORIENTATION=+
MNVDTATEFWRTVGTTFLASIKSVGTACTLASVGVYLHQRGFVVGNGKRTLALISQQVTIPLLFFTKILFCNQDWSDAPCPNVTESLRDVWILLLWPVWVCVAGIFVGQFVLKLANFPSTSGSARRRVIAPTEQQRNAILASVAFGNSTGLPITLLTVIHANFGASSELGAIDPALFLSVYLVLYPVLQWGIGGMLLAAPTNVDANSNNNTFEHDNKIKENDPEDDLKDCNDEDCHQTPGAISSQLCFNSSLRQSIRGEIDRTKAMLVDTEKSFVNNVIHNNKKMPAGYQIAHRGLDTMDASLYWTIHENLNRWGQPLYGTTPLGSGNNLFATNASSGDDIKMHIDSTNKIKKPFVDNIPEMSSGANIGMDLSEHHEEPLLREGGDTEAPPLSYVTTSSVNNNEVTASEASALLKADRPTSTKISSSLSTTTSSASGSSSTYSSSSDRRKITATIQKILTRCFQPPVIAALLGLLFASFPVIRGTLVDIEDRNGDAPLQWFFDGLYEAGRAAVPINMIILGCNLSASYMVHSPMVDWSSKSAKEASIIPSSSSNNTDNHNNDFFGTKTIILVVFGKMILMPLVGYTSTFLLSFVYTVPQEIAGSLYLVLSIVFLCPTANNIMVMIELGSSNDKDNSIIKESMARIIACQYAIAPLVLSGTVTGAVLMAKSMAQFSQPKNPSWGEMQGL